MRKKWSFDKNFQFHEKNNTFVNSKTSNMTKTTKNAGKSKKENKAPQSLPDDFFGLLRAVVNGDEEARQQLKTILDIVDAMPPMPQGEENFNPLGTGWEPDLVFKGKLTLKRKDVKEYHLRIIVFVV